MLGAPQSQQQQDSLAAESLQYRDIIQKDFTVICRIYKLCLITKSVLSRLQDHYRNMSIKHLAAMEWVSEYCLHANWLIKTDDDTFVDIFHAVSFLQLHQPKAFYCRKITGKPVRSSSAASMRKWFVSTEEYSKSKYPW